MKALFLALLCPFLLGGCSSSAVHPDDPDAKEVQSKDGKIVDTPEEELFEKAERYFERGSYNSASDSFTSLRDSYPFGRYAETAQIRLAEIEFEREKYGAAALLFEEAVKRHPASKRREYLQMQLGRSHQLAYRGAGRNITPIEKALSQYEAFLAQYPDSRYAREVRQFAREAGRSLVEHERIIMQFYKRRGNQEAYLARKAIFEEKWKPLLDDLKRQELADSKKSPQTKGKRLSKAEVIAVSRQKTGTNSAATPADSPVLGKLTEIQQPSDRSKAEDTAERANITNIFCSADGEPTVRIDLDRSLDTLEFYKMPRLVSSTAGVIAIKLPGITVPRNLEIDCFGSGDLRVFTTGDFRLLSEQNARLSAIANPSTLLLLLLPKEE